MAVPLGRAPWSSFLRFHLHAAGAHRQDQRSLCLSLNTGAIARHHLSLFLSVSSARAALLSASLHSVVGRPPQAGRRPGGERSLPRSRGEQSRALSKSKRASVGHGQQSDPSAAHVHLGTATRYGKRGLGHRQVILLWSWGRRGVGGGRSRCACPLSNPQRHRRRRRHRLRT